KLRTTGCTITAWMSAGASTSAVILKAASVSRRIVRVSDAAPTASNTTAGKAGIWARFIGTTGPAKGATANRFPLRIATSQPPGDSVRLADVPDHPEHRGHASGRNVGLLFVSRSDRHGITPSPRTSPDRTG